MAHEAISGHPPNRGLVALPRATCHAAGLTRVLMTPAIFVDRRSGNCLSSPAHRVSR